MTDPTDLFAIVPVSSSGDANAKEAICIGPMSEVFAYLPHTTAREEAEAELERARVAADQIMQSANRAVQVAAFADGVTHLERRLDAFERRRAEQARRDAEGQVKAEAERMATHLAVLPDVDDPDTWDGPRPSGELTPIAASHPEDKRQLAALDQGALPSELLQGAPPDPGNYPLGLDDARRAAVSTACECNILSPSSSA